MWRPAHAGASTGTLWRGASLGTGTVEKEPHEVTRVRGREHVRAAGRDAGAGRGARRQSRSASSRGTSGAPIRVSRTRSRVHERQPHRRGRRPARGPAGQQSTRASPSPRARSLSVESQAGHPPDAGHPPAGSPRPGCAAWAPRSSSPTRTSSTASGSRVKAKQLSKIARLPNVQAVLTVPTPHHRQHQHGAVPGRRQDLGPDRQHRQGRQDRHHRHGHQLLPRRLRGRGQRGLEGGRPHHRASRAPSRPPRSSVATTWSVTTTTPTPSPCRTPTPTRSTARTGRRDGAARHARRGHRGRHRRDRRRQDLHRPVRHPHPRRHRLPHRPRRGAPGQAAGLPRLRLRGLDVPSSSTPSSGPSGPARTSSTCPSARPSGTPARSTAVAADNASLAGVVVVAASGNEGAVRVHDGQPRASRRAPSRWPPWTPCPAFPGARPGHGHRRGHRRPSTPTTPHLPVSGKLNVFRDDPSTPADPDTGEGDESLGCFAEDYTYNGFDGRPDRGRLSRHLRPDRPARSRARSSTPRPSS